MGRQRFLPPGTVELRRQQPPQRSKPARRSWGGNLRAVHSWWLIGLIPISSLADNLGKSLRRLALPRSAKHWSLTTVREKPIKIGAKVVRHASYVTFQMAEVAVPRELFAPILERIRRFGVPPPLVQRERPSRSNGRLAIRVGHPLTLRGKRGRNRCPGAIKGTIGTMEQPRRRESRQERSFHLNRVVRMDMIAA
ncbi:MAG: hypothetical protein GY778_20305 [bacterium]|nr:hypothetical protein [bacterium]